MGCGAYHDSPDSTTPDATTNPDASVDDAPTMIDAVTVDVPVKPADSMIQCGTTLTCSAQTQVCCHHSQSISKPYECVSSISDCAEPADVPIGCSGVANCVSQGTPSYICCANTANTGACETATDVSCMATCDTGGTQLKIGCSGSDPCPTNAPMCRMSTCSLSGYLFCAAN
jgi:hypothetical protein